MPKLVRFIDTENSSSAYFSPATITDAKEVIHVSGQVGATTGGHVPSDYASQIHLALLNLRKILVASGTSVTDILKINYYIVGYDPSNRVHAPIIKKFLGGHRPATTLVPVQQLAAKEWLFEIDAVIAKHATELPRQLDVVPQRTTSVDVVVIGAGLAGLVAARDVIHAGFSCLVLESRDRVGGRTWSKLMPNGNGSIELGAAWINDTNQTRMIDLARRYGAELVEQNTAGNCVLQDHNGAIMNFPYSELPGFGPETKAHLAAIRDMVEADCQALNCARPKDTALDALSFAAYLRQRGASDLAISTATIWTRAMLGQEPEHISALYFLNYCKSGGGLIQMRSDRKDGAQYLRIRQGTQYIAKKIAQELPAGTIHLNEPVTAVNQSTSGQVLVNTSRRSIVTRKIISAVPQTTLLNIDFAPALPPAKALLTSSFNYGYYTKAMMVFSKPFWSDAGFCGLIQSFTGPASVIRDTSFPADSKWVLTCFMAGTPGREWAAKSDDGKREALLTQMRQLWGSNSSDDIGSLFVDMVFHEWSSEKWSGYGCPCPALPPGVLDVVGDELRAPTGAVHFAGTETAAEWKGYMEGAVRSGERAASEVVGRLKAGARL